MRRASLQATRRLLLQRLEVPYLRSLYKIDSLPTMTDGGWTQVVDEVVKLSHNRYISLFGDVVCIRE